MEDMYFWFLAQPKRLMALGQALITAGAALIALGVAGHLAVGLSAVAAHAGGKAPPSLGEIYVGLPTWFVPEGAVGVIVTAALIASGAWVIYTARKLQRAYG